MRYGAILAAVALAVACSSKDKTEVADTAAGAMAPAGDVQDTKSTSGTTAAPYGSRGTSTTDTTGTAGTAAAPNQTQSGVTDTKTGTSTLGKNIKKLEPAEGKTVNRETRAP
jgi:SMC interacting uncharacterized protein involved in chromosome segregation